MRLFKKTTHTIDGFEGNVTTSAKFILSHANAIEDQQELTQDDVQYADVVSLSWDTYTLIAEVTSEEIAVLKKFDLISEK